MTTSNNIQANQQDRIVRETERLQITSISRSQAWQLEQKDSFPRRVKLGNRSVGWKLSELLEWVNNQPRVKPSPNHL